MSFYKAGLEARKRSEHLKKLPDYTLAGVFEDLRVMAPSMSVTRVLRNRGGEILRVSTARVEEWSVFDDEAIEEEMRVEREYGIVREDVSVEYSTIPREERVDAYSIALAGGPTDVRKETTIKEETERAKKLVEYGMERLVKVFEALERGERIGEAFALRMKMERYTLSVALVDAAGILLGVDAETVDVVVPETLQEIGEYTVLARERTRDGGVEEWAVETDLAQLGVAALWLAMRMERMEEVALGVETACELREEVRRRRNPGRGEELGGGREEGIAARDRGGRYDRSAHRWMQGDAGRVSPFSERGERVAAMERMQTLATARVEDIQYAGGGPVERARKAAEAIAANAAGTRGESDEERWEKILEAADLFVSSARKARRELREEVEMRERVKEEVSDEERERIEKELQSIEVVKEKVEKGMARLARVVVQALTGVASESTEEGGVRAAVSLLRRGVGIWTVPKTLAERGGVIAEAVEEAYPTPEGTVWTLMRGQIIECIVEVITSDRRPVEEALLEYAMYQGAQLVVDMYEAAEMMERNMRGGQEMRKLEEAAVTVAIPAAIAVKAALEAVTARVSEEVEEAISELDPDAEWRTRAAVVIAAEQAERANEEGMDAEEAARSTLEDWMESETEEHKKWIDEWMGELIEEAQMISGTVPHNIADAGEGKMLDPSNTGDAVEIAVRLAEFHV